jgi:hypothetical protein
MQPPVQQQWSFPLHWLQPASNATSQLTFSITSQGVIQGHVLINKVSQSTGTTYHHQQLTQGLASDSTHQVIQERCW